MLTVAAKLKAEAGLGFDEVGLAKVDRAYVGGVGMIDDGMRSDYVAGTNTGWSVANPNMQGLKRNLQTAERGKRVKIEEDQDVQG